MTSSEESAQQDRLWHGKPGLIVLVLLALGVTVGIPGAGVLGAFVIAGAVSLIARKHGSYRDMGFRRPVSWSELLGATLAYGVVIQLAIATIIEPGLSLPLGSKSLFLTTR